MKCMKLHLKTNNIILSCPKKHQENLVQEIKTDVSKISQYIFLLIVAYFKTFLKITTIS